MTRAPRKCPLHATARTHRGFHWGLPVAKPDGQEVLLILGSTEVARHAAGCVVSQACVAVKRRLLSTACSAVVKVTSHVRGELSKTSGHGQRRGLCGARRRLASFQVEKCEV
jgi:hypothetical protein